MSAMKNTSDNWSHLSGMDWSYLLQYQPRFADKCDWSKLGGYEWTQLLIARAEFADKCDWDKLDATNWYTLVCHRPEFADKCDMSKFTGGDIVRLFRERGRTPATGLCRRVDECDLSTLTASNWCGILALRPDLVDKFEVATHDWAADEKAVDGDPALLDEEAALSEP